MMRNISLPTGLLFRIQNKIELIDLLWWRTARYNANPEANSAAFFKTNQDRSQGANYRRPSDGR
jgi:hypothetical protein